MGLGDQLMATGMARGAVARGKRIAFGDGRKITWDHNSPIVFRGNPNIAPPGSENDHNLEWNPYRKGHRIYNRQDDARKRWVWNYEFRAPMGEMFFTDAEREHGKRFGSDFILIEPNVEWWKPVAANKDWGPKKYQQVANLLRADGHRVCQFFHAGSKVSLLGVERIETRDFRDALAILANARLYIGPEGGLHHGAAAVGVPGVVIFGGFIPARVTGYDTHTNLDGGSEACGSLMPCGHCREAMAGISVEHVQAAAESHLNR